MSRSWSRWWAYMDQVEEAMRVCGVHLAEVERQLSQSYERSSWRGAKRDSVAGETIRRALDIPFFRQLIRDASKLGDLDQLENPNFFGPSWRPGEDLHVQTSETRMPDKLDTSRVGQLSDEVPARVMAAERALQARSRSIAVVLDNLINPRNISAIARTTEALGLQELHIIHAQGRPKLERKLSLYSYRWLDIFWHKHAEDALAHFRGRNFQILAADVTEQAQSVEEVPLDGPVALVFGSEQTGVSEPIRCGADGFFYLPTPGFTSYINVSVALGISLYAIDRRMRKAGLRESLSSQDRDKLRPAWYAMLGRGNAALSRSYLAWAEQPPEISR